MSKLRTNLIRLASTLPKGSMERKALLEVLATEHAGKFTVQFTVPNLYRNDPTAMAKFIEALNTVFHHGVKSPVGHLVGGKVDPKRFLVSTVFTPESPEVVAAFGSKIDHWYTKKALWPFFWTLVGRGGVLDQVRKKLPDIGEILDIDWYMGGSQTVRLGSTHRQGQSAAAYKALGRMDTHLGADFAAALKHAEECLKVLTGADKRMGVLVNKIETEMADIKAAAKASGDPYAYDDDPKYDALLLAHNAADSLQRLRGVLSA